MKRDLYLGIDIGTSGLKVIVVDLDADIIAEDAQEYPVEYSAEGRAEQDPEVWCTGTKQVLERLIPSLPENTRIAGIGLSGQMHGLVTLDKDGNIIRPCILWNDQRSKAQAEQILQRHSVDGIIPETNNGLLPGYLLPKLLWMREYEPNLYRKIQHVLLPKDYLRYWLTGEIVTDHSDASGTGCFNVRTGEWAWDLIDQLEIPREWFPEAHPATDCLPEPVQIPGYHEKVPMVIGAGDAILQLLAARIADNTKGLLVIGTGGNVTMIADRYRDNRNGSQQFFCGFLPGQYIAMGATLSAGESFRWFRNLLNDSLQCLPQPVGKITFRNLSHLANGKIISRNSPLFAPYLQGERCPHTDPAVRGVFAGLSSSTDVGDLVLSIMEGVSFSLLDVFQSLGKDSGELEYCIMAGGATRSEQWIQLVADVFNMPIRVSPLASGGSACGAALLTLMALNPGGTTLPETKGVQEFVPDPDRTNLLNERFGDYRKLYGMTNNLYGHQAS